MTTEENTANKPGPSWPPDWPGPSWPHESKSAFMEVMGKDGENPTWGDLFPLFKHQKARAEAAAALDAALRDLLEKATPQDITPDTKPALAGWLENANPEGLSDWLEKGGWAKVDKAELDKALLEVTPTPELETLQKVLAAKPGADSAEARLLGLHFSLRLYLWPALGLKQADGKPAKWLRLLAWEWLLDAADKARERLEREAKARRLDVKTVRAGAGHYARLPKLAAGISWAFGGAGVKLPEGYKAAPSMAALVPPGFALLRESDLAKAHQTALPLLVEGDDTPPLVLAVTGANRDVFTPVAAWLSVHIMAATWDKPDVLQGTTLRELTTAIYPDAPRLRSMHFESVAAALNMMRNARILWPAGYADALFYVPRWTWKTPAPEHLDAPLVVGLEQHFLQKTLPEITDATGVKSMNGTFLFNYTGTMHLPKDSPGLLRQYLRAEAIGATCYEFGTGKPTPDRVPEVPTERWAVLTNYLPSKSGLDGKDPRPAGRVAKSKAIKRMLAHIDELADRQLVKVDRADTKAVRLLQTEADLDAWDAFRAGKARKTKD